MGSCVGEPIFIPLSKRKTSKVGRSAFHMLRYPHFRSADLVKTIPALNTLDPRVLARVDINGMPLHSMLPSTTTDSISS
jgi:hypothetical protein